MASVAVALHELLPGFTLLSEQEIRAHEREEQELLASARLGALTGARQQLHRPDLALIDPTGGVHAVEVELSVKARADRLQAICTGWVRARHIQRVYYLAAPVAAGALTRAAYETRSQDRITILALGARRHSPPPPRERRWAGLHRMRVTRGCVYPRSCPAALLYGAVTLCDYAFCGKILYRLLIKGLCLGL